MLPTLKTVVDPSPINSTLGNKEATTLGTLAVLMASTNPSIVLLGLTGTATSMLLIRMVSPLVNTGLAMVVVVIP
jgi:hypothetical protein